MQKAKEEEEMFAMRREIKKLRETLAAMEEKTKEVCPCTCNVDKHYLVRVNIKIVQ